MIGYLISYAAASIFFGGVAWACVRINKEPNP